MNCGVNGIAVSPSLTPCCTVAQTIELAVCTVYNILIFLTYKSRIPSSIHVCTGYDGGVTGGIIEMEPFAQEFFPDTAGVPDTQFYCKYNDRTLQTFASLMHFTGALAAFPAGYYTAKYGRTR